MSIHETVISRCGRYRYQLHRPLFAGAGTEPRTVLWVMLNPSVADDLHDDATIRRCKEFSSRWGFRHLLVGNLFAYRATQPAELWAARWREQDIIGPETNARLAVMAAAADQVIYAWGNHAEQLPQRAEEVARTIQRINPEVYVLGYTKSGQPMHPVRLPYAVERTPWAA